jgi:hypothetical protein
MGGMTATGIPWNIMPGSILVVDPGTPNSEIVSVLPNPPPTATTFTASFQTSHTAPFVIRVLAYSQELQYIQQPDDFIVTPGVNPQSPAVRRISPGIWGATGWMGNVVVLEPAQPGQPASDFTGGLTNPTLFPVQPGDYLEAMGNGLVHLILPPVSPTQLQLKSSFMPVPPAPGSPFAPLTSQYRIIRAPRVLQGETPLELSPKVVVDISPKILGVADPPLPIDPRTGNIDIMFSPSGAVMGRKIGLADKIVLWVRDGTRDVGYPVSAWPPGGSPGDQYLVTIQVRTGFIAVHPVDLGNNPPDPYRSVKDDRSSGL